MRPDHVLGERVCPKASVDACGRTRMRIVHHSKNDKN